MEGGNLIQGSERVSNAGLPGEPSELPSVGGDIPEARRDLPEPHARVGGRWKYLGLGVLGVAIALLFSIVLSRFLFAPPPAEVSPLSPAFTPLVQEGGTSLDPSTLLGHFPYEEAPPESLRPIVADGSIQLREAAAESLLALLRASRADGVNILPLSGFRSIEDQEYLFFDIKAEQGERAAERAEVSAPPGYSEHHTGYAVDLGDGDRPETHLQEEFERTAAFRWLRRNSAYYSFELSFPRNNPQGISYEPWHWRFVGDRDSLETFYKARSVQGETR